MLFKSILSLRFYEGLKFRQCEFFKINKKFSQK